MLRRVDSDLAFEDYVEIIGLLIALLEYSTGSDCHRFKTAAKLLYPEVFTHALELWAGVA